MNLSTLRAYVRLFHAEATAAKSFLLDADINKWINMGSYHACRKAFVLEKTDSITVTTGDATYDTPYALVRVVNLINHNSKSLTPIKSSEFGRVWKISGLPLHYYITTIPIVYTARANLTAYAAGAFVIPATANGYLYECVTGGTSAGAPPTYSVVIGGTTADGTVVWGTRELTWQRYQITLIDTPTTAGGGTGTYSLIYNSLDNGIYVDTDAPNFPEEYHLALVFYASAMGYLKKQNHEKALTMWKAYLDVLSLSEKEEPLPGAAA